MSDENGLADVWVQFPRGRRAGDYTPDVLVMSEDHGVKTIKSIDGIDIIQQGQAYGSHPHPRHKGELRPFTGVLHLLLEDGTERYMDDVSDCDKTFTSVQSVVAHMGSHSPRTTTYTDDVITDVISTVLRFINHHDKYVRAASELNDLGRTKHPNDDKWYAATVRYVFTTYRKNPRFTEVTSDTTQPKKQRRQVKAVKATAPSTRRPVHDSTEKTVQITDLPVKMRNNRDSSNDLDDLRELVGQLGRNLSLAQGAYDAIMVLLENINPYAQIDPEIIQKAHKYDLFKKQFND